MSDIEEWGQNRYGAHRFPWPQYVNGDYAQLEAYAKLLGVDTTHDLEQTGQGYGLLDLQRQKGGHYIGKTSGEPT
jgi:hypothetical protein